MTKVIMTFKTAKTIHANMEALVESSGEKSSGSVRAGYVNFEMLFEAWLLIIINFNGLWLFMIKLSRLAGSWQTSSINLSVWVLAHLMQISDFEI